MKHLRKSILTLLALTLFGGAWAQNSWQSSSSQASYTVALADVTVTFNGDWSFNDDYARGTSNGQTITIAPTADGDFMLVFGGSIGDSKPIHMMNNDEMVYVAGTKVGAPDVTVEGSGVAFASGEGVVYALEAGVAYNFFVGATTWRLASFSFAPAPEPAQEIELTKSGANQWTLGQTPDYDLELQVEYYEAHALKNIPEGWTVMVNGVPQTQPYQGDSLMITETDSVTLIPAGNPRRVKSVTLEDDGPAVQTITVAGLQLNYVEGETWVQTAQRNPGVITIDGSYVNKMNGSYFLKAGGSTVSPTSTYDSSLSDSYWWEEW